MNDDFVWDEPATDLLIQRWRAGDSLRTIEQHFLLFVREQLGPGAISPNKNGLAGKVDRLKKAGIIQGRDSPLGQGARPSRPRSPMPPVAVPRLVMSPPLQPIAVDSFAAESTPIDSTPVSTRTCCWPIGEPGERGFRYCDDPCDASVSPRRQTYCVEHRKSAYLRGRSQEQEEAA